MQANTAVLFPISLETLTISICMSANRSSGCTFLECETCKQPCKDYIRRELRRLCGLPQVDSVPACEETTSHDHTC